MRRLQAEIGGKAGEHADREHVAMREFDDIENAEEQREPHRHQGIHDAQHQSVDEVLQRDVHASAP